MRDFARVAPADLKLVIVALLAIGTLVVLVTRFRVNAFLALLLASLVVGASAVGMGRTLHDGAGRPLAYTMSGVVKSFSEGLGATLGGIATVIGLGTMLGKLLAESGGAEVLAKRFAAFFGPKHIQWCIMALALAVGLTTWFAVGFVLLLPILLSLTHETKQPFLSLVLPLLSCMSVMHGADAAASRAGGRGRDAERADGPGAVLGLRDRHPDGGGRRAAVRALRRRAACRRARRRCRRGSRCRAASARRPSG